MRTYLAAGILLGLLAGCTSHQEPTTGAAAAAAAKSALPGDVGMAFTSRSPMSSFASLPDRGELLAYEKGRQVKQKAAYTAYPVAISEAHALNAMRTGEMVVNAPNGEPIRLTYERHEENPDGNWTWIGRNADGASAVITFGEKAVFGTIPQGATESLRLTMSAGQSWLVQTDRSKLAGMGGEPRREGGDQLIPPKLAGSGEVSMASSQAQPVTAAASASAVVVDVLLGYTNGYASQLGGQASATTRLVNMIAITNDAYNKSGVNMRVRLVKTLQVTYPDNTDNGDALEKLTGYKAGTSGGPITPDPAFKALREMRDEVGADLVSLVRAFRTPENAGCGIAWLIGGDQEDIVQGDAPFGYSVVSDGTDLDEEDDNTYFCREETLAHELGHNMGQAHNEEDSDSTGAHAYSYGYRETSSTGFYTVMAYPRADGSQFSIPYFANPDVKYLNRVTGVANKSDNVRSLNQVMPTIAKFRATIVPLPQGAPNDFNGDGASDIFWRATSGANTYWKSANFATRQVVTTVPGQAWQVVGTGDFNGDGKSDVLWRNSTTGANTIWLSADSTTVKTVTSVANAAWKVAATGDFNGDGISDILWRNSSTGANTIWLSGNSATEQAVTTVGVTAWQVVGADDFNGDGKADILWRNSSTGANTIWLSGNSGTVQAVTTVAVTSWHVVGTGDFNGDGKADILWRNSSTGANAIWLSGDSGKSQNMAAVPSQAWRVVGVGDYNGDGKSDVLWRNFSSGANTIWTSANSGAVKSVTSVPEMSWRVVP